jgi:hypothetical protein
MKVPFIGGHIEMTQGGVTIKGLEATDYLIGCLELRNEHPNLTLEHLLWFCFIEDGRVTECSQCGDMGVVDEMVVEKEEFRSVWYCANCKPDLDINKLSELKD